jgi:hypothetical protein
VDVEAIAEQLYQEDPSSFVAQRDARVSAARHEGDRPTADAIKAFKRPSPPAWAVNLLARAHPDQMEALGDLGLRLRRAQDSLSGDELRALSRERHKFIVGLARQAQSLASGQGHPLSTAAGRQVEDTLNAALADPDAALAVASGRLVRSLEHAGLGPVDLSGAVAGPAASGAAASGAATTGAATASRARQAQPAGAASTAARLAAELDESRIEAAAAEQALGAAELAARDAASALDRASEGRVAAEAEVRRLAELLEAARTDAAAAKAEISAAAGSRKDAERSLDGARRRAREAQERLIELEERKPTGDK